MAAKKKIDYESIWPDWDAGIKSVPQLAKEYTERTGVKVSHTAINKYFKEKNISRSLEGKIRAAAEAKVSAAKVSANVSSKVTSETIIEANAEYAAQIRLNQHERVGRIVEIIDNQSAELKNADDYPLNQRISMSKQLAESTRMLIDTESKIHKLDEQPFSGSSPVNIRVEFE